MAGMDVLRVTKERRKSQSPTVVPKLEILRLSQVLSFFLSASDQSSSLEKLHEKDAVVRRRGTAEFGREKFLAAALLLDVLID